MECDKYEFCSKVHLVFYSYDSDSNMKLLFYKQNEKLSIISTAIEEKDNYAPTFGIAREISSTFGNLFCEDTLSLILSKHKLTEQNIQVEPRKIKSYLVWNDKSFIYWLDKISKDIIQYDSINKEVIYFVELPFIQIDDLNKNLSEINYFTSFAYITQESFGEHDICPSVLSLLSSIIIKSHIEDTLKKMSEGNTDQYIVLACKNAGDNQAGFFHFPALFTGLYRKNCEKWIYLVASVDPLPTDEQLSKCKCLIIPGSDLNVYQDIPFLRKTEEFLKKLVNNLDKYPKLKLLGICFGLEIILNALGAKIDTVGRQKFQRTPELLEFDDSFWELLFVKNSNVQPTKHLKIAEAHMDYIKELPTNYKFINYAKSKSCDNEIIVSEDEKIFLIQGHPEYYFPFLINRTVTMMLKFKKMEETTINIERLIKEEASIEANKGVNIKEYRQLCYYFMKQ